MMQNEQEMVFVMLGINEEMAQAVSVHRFESDVDRAIVDATANHPLNSEFDFVANRAPFFENEASDQGKVFVLRYIEYDISYVVAVYSNEAEAKAALDALPDLHDIDCVDSP